MKMSAAELRDLEANDVLRFEQHMLATLHRPYLFKLKVAEETYQDETRIKINIMRCALVHLLCCCSIAPSGWNIPRYNLSTARQR